jgi:hypothetical protein
MFKIPDEFRDIPEAVKVREAEVCFEAAIEQEKRATQDSGERVHLISSQLRQAQEELQRAQDAFDAATGEPKLVGLTPALVEEVAKHFPPVEHQQVRELLDRGCGRTIPFRREATAEQLEWTRLAVLRLSKGDFSELGKWVELANIDERDVVDAALPLMKGHRDT